MKKPAIFLDRDGTINIEKNYLHKIEDWEWIPGAIDAIRMINEMGFLVVVVTNQAGVARGYYSEQEIKELHDFVSDQLKKNNASIDAYYFCPHHPEFGELNTCTCRKPDIGMILNAVKDYDIDLSNSWLIGDKSIDMEAATRLGIEKIMVMTGYGKKERLIAPKSTVFKKDILDAVLYIRENRNS